jgi:hypothetical protein
MKLYRITVVTPVKNIERGVWASQVGIENDHIIFVDDEDELIASYPAAITMITNVETKEEYEARKGKVE